MNKSGLLSICFFSPFPLLPQLNVKNKISVNGRKMSISMKGCERCLNLGTDLS